MSWLFIFLTFSIFIFFSFHLFAFSTFSLFDFLSFWLFFFWTFHLNDFLSFWLFLRKKYNPSQYKTFQIIDLALSVRFIHLENCLNVTGYNIESSVEISNFGKFTHYHCRTVKHNKGSSNLEHNNVIFPFMCADPGVLLLLSHWWRLSNDSLLVGSLNLPTVLHQKYLSSLSFQLCSNVTKNIARIAKLPY